MSSDLDLFLRTIEAIGIDDLTHSVKMVIKKLLPPNKPDNISIDAEFSPDDDVYLEILNNSEYRLMFGKGWPPTHVVRREFFMDFKTSQFPDHLFSVWASIVQPFNLTDDGAKPNQCILELDPDNYVFSVHFEYEGCLRCGKSERIKFQKRIEEGDPDLRKVSFLCEDCSYCHCGRRFLPWGAWCTNHRQFYMYSRFRLQVPKDVIRMIMNFAVSIEQDLECWFCRREIGYPPPGTNGTLCGGLSV